MHNPSTIAQYIHYRALAAKSPPRPRRSRLRGDLGEGIISAAIAVLIMAFLGVLVWIGLRGMWESTEDKTNDQIEQIGS